MATDMEKLVEDWFAAWNSRDSEKLGRFYTDDAVFDHVASGRVFRGKNELLAFFKATFIEYPDFKIEQKVAFYSANAVCSEVVVSGTHAHSTDPAVIAASKHFSVRGAAINEWKNGKVKRTTYYEDELTVLRQLSLIPNISPKK